MATVDKDFKVKNSVTAGIGYRVRSTANPVAPTVALAGLGAGNVDNGTHYYFVTYVTANGETNLSSGASVTVADKTVNGQVTVTIPTSSDTRVTARKIYRNTANSNSWVEVKLLATINDNTTTTYTDNIADASTSWPPTGANTSYYYKDNTTTKPLKDETGNYPLLHATAMNTAVGRNSLATIVAGTSVGGSNNAFGKDTLYSLTTGAQNNVFGTGSGALITTGNDNVLMGHTAGAGLTTGNYNIFLGRNTGYGVATSGHNVFIGYYAGYGPGTTNQNPASNIAIGSSSLQKITTANNNVAIGVQSGVNVTTGGTNTALGTNALYTNSTGTGNVAVGYYAGAYETGTGYFYVNNQDRTNLAGDQTKSLLYGTFNATASSQQLTVNGTLNATYPLVGADTTDSSSTTTGAFKTAGGMGVAKTLYVGTGANIAGGKTTLAATTTGYASLNVPHGTAPSAPADGDFWTTTSGAYVRINGVTVGPLASSAGAGTTWGAITGTLSSQTDLQTALDAKLNLSGGTLTGSLTLPGTAGTRNLFMSSGHAVLGLVTIGHSGAGYGTIGDGYRTTSLSNSYNYDRNDYATMIDFASGSIKFKTAGIGTAGNPITYSTPMTIANNGAVTLTGDLTVSKANPRIVLSDVAGSQKAIRFETSGALRWFLASNQATESGSNAGSDFVLNAYTDGGAYLSTPLTITRSTGAVTLTGDLTISKASSSLLLSATSGSPSVNISGVAGTFRGLQFKTAGTRRWTMYANADAESGSDVGSDFALYRANDAGSETRVMYIQRSTGNVTFDSATTLTGDLTIGKASPVFTVSASSGNAYHVISAAASATAGTIFRSAGSTRWVVGKNETPDSSTATGSDFVVRAYDNNAALLSTPLTITRSTGATTFTGDLTVSKTAPSINALGSGNSVIQSQSTSTHADLTAKSTSGGYARLNLDRPATKFGYTILKTAGSARWSYGVNDEIEAGSNTGSNFFIYRYDDAGVFIDVPLKITRSTGATTLTGDLTVSKASPVLGLSASSGTPSLNIDSPAAAYDSYLNFRTGTSARWSWSKGGTESGTNAGSNLYLYAYSDAGALLSTPLTITRSTGAVALTGDLTVGPNKTLSLDASAGSATSLKFTTSGANRWLLQKTNTAESGANAGSDLVLYARDDSGNAIGTALSITRSTMAATFGGSVTAASFSTTGTTTTAGIKRALVTKTAAYTLTTSDNIVVATTGTWNATLPTAVSAAGTEYIIKNSGTGTITVDTTSSQTIDGSLTVALAQYDSLTVVSDGTNWVIV